MQEEQEKRSEQNKPDPGTGGAAQMSPSQYRAVTCGDGPVLVLAGPGSGKTLVITHRVRYLLESGKAAPQQILVVTFSRAAAREMRQRFEKLMPDAHGVLFGTFHGIFFQILKRAYHYTGQSVLREEERFSCIEEAASECGLDLSAQREVLGALSTEISLVKNEQIRLEDYYSTSCADRVFRSIYRRYEEKLRSGHRIDFDDMLVQCYELLREREDILRQWQRCFRYILVDEFQDINRLQYAVLRMLLLPENNLFAVGDDDQSIYRFRGAAPEIMLGFERDFPDGTLLNLEENYRCAPSIVHCAGRVIAANRHRYAKTIRAVRSDESCLVAVKRAADPSKEAGYIIERIRRSIGSGCRPDEIAVLVRNNREGRYFAEKFLRYEIPFVMREMSFGIYDHWIFQDLLAYLRLAAGERSRKDFLRIMNHPLRYISRSCVDSETVSFDRLRYWYEEKPWMVQRLDELEEDLQYMGGMRPFAAINYLRRRMGYDDYLKEYAREKGINEEELLQVIEELQESSAACANALEWNSQVLTLKEAASRQRTEEGRDAVVLSTLHSAKGLEFEEVFLPDVNETILPGRRARLEADIEEERRLFYVGMTRAKKRLHILFVKERFGRSMKPSRFLTQTGDGSLFEASPVS